MNRGPCKKSNRGICLFKLNVPIQTLLTNVLLNIGRICLCPAGQTLITFSTATIPKILVLLRTWIMRGFVHAAVPKSTRTPCKVLMKSCVVISGAALNMVLNDNSSEVYNHIKAELMKMFSNYFTEIANAVLIRYPEKQLFPD